MTGKAEADKKQFVEDFGILFERVGVPRMAGRIWGWLLLCEPPHQSAAQLAEALGASRGSISTMTRLLMQLGLIEPIGLPGERNRFYCAKSGALTELLRAKMSLTTEVRKMAERGLALLKNRSPRARRRLEECRDFYAFFEKEFPALIEKWEKKRGTSRS